MKKKRISRKPKIIEEDKPIVDKSYKLNIVLIIFGVYFIIIGINGYNRHLQAMQYQGRNSLPQLNQTIEFSDLIIIGSILVLLSIINFIAYKKYLK